MFDALVERAIRVLFCCDPGYYQHLAVAILSMLRSNAVNFIEIHLISSRLDMDAEAKLRRSFSAHDNYTLKIHYWQSQSSLHTSYHITREAYTRLNAATILPDWITKVIYLDSDLVVLDDLSPLWRTNVDGHALAAAPDPYGLGRREALGMPASATYVNSGVLVLNLQRWRTDNLPHRLAVYIATAGTDLLFHDQDAINAVLYDATLRLPYRWNVQTRMMRASGRAGLSDRKAIAEAARSPAIIHYTSARKPWMFVMATPRKRLYRRHLKLTAWRGAPPEGRRWRAVPEYLVNHAFYVVGSAYTWDRFLRATATGRILSRLLRRGRQNR